jgi:hypothetical protein
MGDVEWLTTFMRVVGFALLAGGVGCVVIAMTLCTSAKGTGIVWLRGSFQRRDHYTKVGWRLYHTGLVVGMLGLLIAALTAR